MGQAFSNLPLDHLLFTGATSVARHIMAAAARNLVPVTLELGGKSPVIISRTADIEKSLGRIMMGKTLNAGQICLAPDYLMVPRGKTARGDRGGAESGGRHVSHAAGQPRSTPRWSTSGTTSACTGYLAEAEERGVKTIAINPASEDFSQQQGTHKIPPTLIPEPPEDLKVLQEEIFGPLLPIRTYREFDETIDYVNANPRPLAAYYFGEDAAEEQAVDDPHHLRRRVRQRCDHARHAGRPALRRRGPQRHGLLPWPGGFPAPSATRNRSTARPA